MRIYISLLFLCCTSILIAQEEKQSLLWEVSGNGMEKPSFLYGTMHVSKKVAFRLDDVFFKALEEAETVALESDPTTWLAHNYEQMSDSDASPRSYGGENFYNRNFNPQFSEKEAVRRIIRFDNRIINGYLYRKQAGADDFEEETYLDMFIYQAGKKNNKPIISLEDIKESKYLTSRAAYNILKKRPDEWVQKMFKDQNRYTVQEDAYRDRNIYLLDSIGAAVNTDFYREHMLYKRNENMVIVMDSLMQHKTVFAGVGAAHLAGEKGMLQMLEDRGYKVRPLTSEQTDFALKAKVELEDLHVQPYLNSYSTPDGFITIKTFDELREFVYKEQKFYLAPDMTNGAYLTITRLNTYDQFPNEEKITLEEIDPLLYEDIPGDIISKEPLTSPFPGFSIVNKTKKGDYQKYHIYKTPLEMIIIKFGGKKDFVLQYEKEIFDSIKFREPSNALNTYTSEYGKYEFLFPVNYISDNTKNVGNKLLQAAVNDEYYFFKEVFNNDVGYIEEDAFEASYIHDNFYKKLDVEKMDGKFVNHTYKSYESSAIIDTASQKKIYLKSIIKDESYYVLGFIGDDEKKAKTYFNSFKIKAPKYKRFKTVIDTSLHFSVLTNTKQPSTGPSYSSRYNSDKKAYDQEKKYIAYTSKSNEKILVRRIKYHDLQMFHNIDSLWDGMERFYEYNFVIEDKKLEQKDDVYYSTYVLKDTASAKRVYRKNILKKGVLFSLSTLEDSIAEPSEFVKNFYETFTPLDTLLGKDVFVDKTNIFFDGIKNNDSIVLKSYAKIKFMDKHANPIISILKEHEFPEDRENIKNYLISSLGKLENPRIFPFLKELYVEAYDKPKTQTAILRTLLKHKEETSYEMILELLEKDFPLDSRGTTRLFKTGKDNLVLKKELFPELLKYSSIQEYKTPIYELLTQLNDSSLIKPKIYKRYKSQLLNDAKIEVKRNLGKSSYNYKSGLALERYVKLLFPFRKDKNIKDFYNKLIKTEARSALTTYVALLVENNEQIPQELKEKTFFEDKALAPTLWKLAQKDLLAIVPDSLKTQQRYAKAGLISRIGLDKEKDTISFVKTIKVHNEDGDITIYFFKVQEESRYGESNKLYHVAFVDKPKLSTEPYLLTKTRGERIYGDEIDEEMFEKAVDQVKYKRRKRISGRSGY
ncbi:TraB/GumN family protein [uncultured Kordia sp.]|uniref:TraB/GumN family protein n=1 Tax=uncultured Kordia sp. TaxID=507699 RepID=UPI00260AE822|nr:TraB/GumN family protein [uncultured Kordia sp.]